MFAADGRHLVRDGRLDGARTHVLTDRLADRPGELAWAVQEAVLPDGATALHASWPPTSTAPC